MNTSRLARRIVLYGISDRGLQRTNNEDNFIVADLTRKVVGVQNNRVTPELLHHEIGVQGTLLAVADGLGGHERGELASQLAVDMIVQTLFSTAEQDHPLQERLIEAINTAHQAICTYHDNTSSIRHMASTLTAVHVGSAAMTIVQIGDSRAYRFSNGKLTLLTEDQTIVQMMQKRGMLTDEEARNHPHRNVILQALGQGKAVAPVIQTLSWQEDEYLLLCTDGLSSYVPHEQIEAILASGPDEHTCCKRLIDAANTAGGADNVTVLLVRMITEPAADQQSHALLASEDPSRGLENISGVLSVAGLSQEAPRRWFHKATGSAEHATTGIDAEAVPQPSEKRRFWGSKSVKSVEESRAQPSRSGFWWQDLTWPWGSKVLKRFGDDASQPTEPWPPQDVVSSTNQHEKNSGHEESKERWFTQRKTTHASTWDPQVLRMLEEHLAKYVGPVAKILVMRTASQTRNFNKLCRLLTTHLATEEDKKNFLKTVLPSR
jgi:protein phosphatase